MRFRFLLPALPALMLGLAGEAHAHSKLKSSVPANGATVSEKFKEARLDFIEPVEAAMSHFELVTSDGKPVLRAEGVKACKAKTCRFAVELLKPGAYRIDYRILSTDGHVVEGKIRFTVKAGQ
jgi:methionine-rich copper-binding protein CopC